jgi:hypothetical protein
MMTGSSIPLTRVFHRAAVRFGAGIGDALAGGQLFQRRANVVFRFRDIRFISRRNAIYAAFIKQHAFRIDDEELRRVGCRIEFADAAFGIEHGMGWRCAAIAVQLFSGLAINMALFARCRGNDLQPDYALLSRLFLQALDIPGFVMFFHERTLVIGPFQNHGFAV